MFREMYFGPSAGAILRATAFGVLTVAMPLAAGPIGGAAGQTIRIHVSATSGASCSATAKIHYGDLLPALPEQRFDLRPGQAGFVDYSLNRLSDRLGRRVELLPAVQVAAGTCRTAVEVFENNTGRTMVYLSPMDPLIARDLDLDLAPIPASSGQIVRLGAARAFDPQPDPPGCTVTLAFADSRGNPVGPTKTINLRAGQLDFVDLDANLLLPASGEILPYRRIVQPKLLLPASGGATRGCDVTVQVFDQMTGWTTLAAKAVAKENPPPKLAGQ